MGFGCATGGDNNDPPPALSLGGEEGVSGATMWEANETESPDSDTMTGGTSRAAGSGEGDDDDDVADTTTGGDDPGTTGPPPATCPPDPNDDECFACVRDACCPAVLQCEGDPMCSCTLDCIEAGGEPDLCNDDCGGMNEATVAVVTCSYLQCQLCFEDSGSTGPE